MAEIPNSLAHERAPFVGAASRRLAGRRLPLRRGRRALPVREQGGRAPARLSPRRDHDAPAPRSLPPGRRARDLRRAGASRRRWLDAAPLAPAPEGWRDDPDRDDDLAPRRRRTASSGRASSAPSATACLAGAAADPSTAERLKSMDRTGLAVVTLDREGVVTSWNAGATEHYHLEAHETVGRKVLDLAPNGRGPRVRPIAAEPARRARRVGQPAHDPPAGRRGVRGAGHLLRDPLRGRRAERVPDDHGAARIDRPRICAAHATGAGPVRRLWPRGCRHDAPEVLFREVSAVGLLPPPPRRPAGAEPPAPRAPARGRRGARVGRRSSTDDIDASGHRRT